MDSKPRQKRGWVTMTDAAAYVGVSVHDIRRAIAAGDLAAYERPDTAATQRHHIRVSYEDIDAWVRTRWAPAQEVYR